jgi:hypothetical protein
VNSGINVYLFIQLSRTPKWARLWTTLTTVASFFLATAFVLLASYIAFVARANDGANSDSNVFGGQLNTQRIVLALRSIRLMVTWFTDSLVVRHTHSFCWHAC